MTPTAIQTGTLQSLTNGMLLVFQLAMQPAGRPLLLVIDSEGADPGLCCVVMDAIESAMVRGSRVAVFVDRAIGPAALMALGLETVFVSPTAAIGGVPVLRGQSLAERHRHLERQLRLSPGVSRRALVRLNRGEVLDAGELIDAGLAELAIDADAALEAWQQRLEAKAMKT